MQWVFSVRVRSSQDGDAHIVRRFVDEDGMRQAAELDPFHAWAFHLGIMWFEPFEDGMEVVERSGGFDPERWSEEDGDE